MLKMPPVWSINTKRNKLNAMNNDVCEPIKFKFKMWIYKEAKYLTIQKKINFVMKSSIETIMFKMGTILFHGDHQVFAW